MIHNCTSMRLAWGLIVIGLFVVGCNEPQGTRLVPPTADEIREDPTLEDPLANFTGGTFTAEQTLTDGPVRFKLELKENKEAILTKTYATKREKNLVAKGSWTLQGVLVDVQVTEENGKVLSLRNTVLLQFIDEKALTLEMAEPDGAAGRSARVVLTPVEGTMGKPKSETPAAPATSSNSI